MLKRGPMLLCLALLLLLLSPLFSLQQRPLLFMPARPMMLFVKQPRPTLLQLALWQAAEAILMCSRLSV
jgi:hypothetical protein